MSKGLEQLKARHAALQRELGSLRGKRDGINDQIESVLNDLKHAGRAIRDMEEAGTPPPVAIPLDAVSQRLGEDFDEQFGSDRGKQGVPFKGLI